MNVDGKNAGYALKEEIFKWQDKLDDLDYSEEGMMNLYLLTEDILSTLESRLDLSDDFIKEMEEIHNKVDDGNTSDFVKIDLPEKSFFDLVNDYVSAEKIGEVVATSKMLIFYVLSRINDVKCQIYNGKLYICTIGNASISTSIISELLDIKPNNINDSRSQDGIWCIHLQRR